MSVSVDIGIVCLLILLSGFFALAEHAVMSARRPRLRQMAEEGNTGADTVLGVNEEPDSFLSVLRILVVVNTLLIGAFSGMVLSEKLALYLSRFEQIGHHGYMLALFLVILAVSFFVLIVGNLLPRRIALAYPENISVRIAFIIRILVAMFAPLSGFLDRLESFLLRVMRLHNLPDKVVTEDEVKEVIAEGMESGALKPAEKDMMDGVMRLADRTVRMIMTPRIDMVWLNIDDPLREHKNMIHASGYSRFPIAKGDMEEVLGVVHAKDLLNACLDGEPLSIATLMRAAPIIPDTTSVLRLLDQFKRTGQHIAIVVDEYGSVEGLVSITDIIESITGEFPDRGRDTLSKPVRRKDGSWLIDGMMPIDEAESLLGFEGMRNEADFQTIAGFVLDRLGRIPAEGDSVMWYGAKFEVVDMDGRRIDKIVVTPPPDEED